jgi:uncharacterized protein YkwD
MGSDQTSTFDRINRYGKAGWYRAESLVFDGPETAFDIVMQLMVGNKNKSRDILMGHSWNYTGVATCRHATHKHMASIIYSE